VKPMKSSGNSGIQANTVTADVMSVGTGSTATKVVHGGGTADAELTASIDELRNSIAKLPLQQGAKDELASDMTKLEQAAKSKEAHPDQVGGIIQSIVGKLNMVGVVLGEAVAIAEPIKKIATMFRLPFA
jgi:hypothetical protein